MCNFSLTLCVIAVLFYLFMVLGGLCNALHCCSQKMCCKSKLGDIKLISFCTNTFHFFLENHHRLRVLVVHGIKTRGAATGPALIYEELTLEKLHIGLCSTERRKILQNHCLNSTLEPHNGVDVYRRQPMPFMVHIIFLKMPFQHHIHFE